MRVHTQHTCICAHAHPPAITFLVPGQEPGAGDAGGAVGQRVGPAGELVKGAVTDQLCGGTGQTVPLASPMQGAGRQVPHQHLSPQSPSCWDPALALTCGCGQAAHVAVALLAVRLPSLEEEIRDLGRGALGTPGSVTRALPVGATMPCQAATPAQGRPRVSAG